MNRTVSNILILAALIFTDAIGVSAQDRLPYHKADIDTTNRKQIRVLTPQGILNSDLPNLAVKIAQAYSGEFFLVGFFDTRESVDLFKGSGDMETLIEQKTWRCDVRIDRGRSNGTCRSWRGVDLTTRNISGAELSIEGGGTW